MKLLEALNIIRSAPRQAARQFAVDLVCGFTPLHLKTFLAAYLQRLCPDHLVRVETGLYGDLAGNLERAASGNSDVVAVVMEWPDLDPRLGIRAAPAAIPRHDDIHETVWNRMHRIQKIIDQRLGGIRVALSLPSIGARAVSIQPGWLANDLDATLLRCLADFTARASERKNIRLLNSRRLDELSPPHTRWDVSSELATGFPYHLNHASVIADLLSRLIRPPAPKKGLITDLDDTLWRGIVGEVGSDGISWSLERHSHVHTLYQQQLSALMNAGVLVAIASKNDPVIAQQAFRRSDFLLDVTRVFPVEVSWGPKSESVRRILEAWNVGPESVLFVDDNPLELAEVQAAFPETECILFPSDPKAGVDLLDRIRDMFGKQFVTEEDSPRLKSIRVQPKLTGDFLEGCDAEITFSAVKDARDPRPLELINKTNQFNLNGKRYTESDWLTTIRHPQSRVMLVSYKDKYGHLGKVAVLGGRVTGHAMTVDLWVMSCRALSRRIEYQCLRQVFAKIELDEIAFDFERTERNAAIREFFSGLLGATPAGRFTLSRASFEQRCPKLFHAVKEQR